MASWARPALRPFARFRDPAWCFLVVGLAVGVSLCFLIPTLDGIDESAHVARSYRVSTGALLTSPSPTPSYQGGGVCLPKRFATNLNAAEFLAASRNRGLARAGPSDRAGPSGNLSTDQQQRLAEFEGALLGHLSPCRGADHGKLFYETSTFAWYSPLPYLPSAAGIGVARALGLEFKWIDRLGRLGQLLAFVGIVFLAIRRTPWAKWPLCAAALLPVSMFVASTVTPDAITVAFAFLVVASALRMTARPTRGRTMLLEALLLSGLLAFCKPTYWIVSLAYVLPILPLRWQSHAERRRPWFLLAPVAVAGAISSLYQRSQRDLFVCDVRFFRTTPDPSRQVHLILTNPPHFVSTMAHAVRVNASNWFHDSVGVDVHVTHHWPAPIVVLVLLGFLALALQRTPSDADLDLGPSRRVLLLGTALLGLVFVLTGLAIYCSAPGKLLALFTNVRLVLAFSPVVFVAATAGRRHLVDRVPIPPALALVPFYASALTYLALRS